MTPNLLDRSRPWFSVLVPVQLTVNYLHLHIHLQSGESKRFMFEVRKGSVNFHAFHLQDV